MLPNLKVDVPELEPDPVFLQQLSQLSAASRATPSAADPGRAVTAAATVIVVGGVSWLTGTLPGVASPFHDDPAPPSPRHAPVEPGQDPPTEAQEVSTDLSLLPAAPPAVRSAQPGRAGAGQTRAHQEQGLHYGQTQPHQDNGHHTGQTKTPPGDATTDGTALQGAAPHGPAEPGQDSGNHYGQTKPHQDNGHHYGQVRPHQDNGHHYGQTKPHHGHGQDHGNDNGATGRPRPRPQHRAPNAGPGQVT